MIQSAFALGCLEALLDLPALTSYSNQGFNRVFSAGSVT
jgi:hypothetical protein